MMRIAHRGMNRLALQNTLPAFQAAIDAKVEGIELDVQRAKCGTPMVFHDDNLFELFGQPGTIQDYRAHELSELLSPLAHHFPAHPPETMRIPRLSDVLTLMRNSDMLINVEIKAPKVQRNSPTRAAYEVIKGSSLPFMVSCFNPLELLRMHRHDTGIPLALLFGEESPHHLDRGWPIPILNAIRLDAIHPGQELVSQKMVHDAHARGLKVNVWTVNNSAWGDWLNEIGVDGLISDVADAFQSS